jgi:hypothetical protein
LTLETKGFCRATLMRKTLVVSDLSSQTAPA